MNNISEKIFFIKDIISRGSYKEAYTLSTDIPNSNENQLRIFESKLNGYDVNKVICLLIDCSEDDISEIESMIDDEMKITYDMCNSGIGPNIIYYDKTETILHNNRKYKYYLCERFINNIGDTRILPKNCSTYLDKLLNDIFVKVSREGYIYLDNKIEHIFYTIEDSNYIFKLIDYDPQFCYKFIYNDGVLQSKIMMVLFLCHYLKYSNSKENETDCTNEIKNEINKYVSFNIPDFIDCIFYCQDKRFAVKNKDKYTIADMYCHYLLYWTGIEWRQHSSTNLMDFKIKHSLIKEIKDLVKL